MVDIFNQNLFRRLSRTQNLTQITDWDIQTQTRNVLFNLSYKLFENKIKNRTRKERNYKEAPID